MPIEVNLSRADLHSLEQRGVRLYGLRETRFLARNSRIEAPTSLVSTVVQGAILEVGAFCNLSGGSINNVRFGRYCSVANGVVVGAHEHPTDWLTTSRTAYYPQVHDWDRLMVGPDTTALHNRVRPFTSSCPVTTIGADVWLGQGAFVKAGVSIGTGAVIGARALVTKDVPPYAIVVGTPGKVVRLRFPEAIIERLLALEWWRFSIYDLFDAPFDHIERAIDVIEAKIAGGSVQHYVAPEITPMDFSDPKGLLARLPSLPLREAS